MKTKIYRLLPSGAEPKAASIEMDVEINLTNTKRVLQVVGKRGDMFNCYRLDVSGSGWLLYCIHKYEEKK